jgi:bifunctional DNA-binding transcriptional regulator/antitoxin component of YhaV-PrlF toxin-antitoxin module
LKGNTENKEITKTWLTGNSSCTLVIPKGFAREYGLDKPTHIIIEKRQEGLLIRKLDVT